MVGNGSSPKTAPFALTGSDVIWTAGAADKLFNPWPECYLPDPKMPLLQITHRSDQGPAGPHRTLKRG
jgi:hypothetical protein